MLRDYQSEIISTIESISDNPKKVCIQMPTGTGKSILIKYFTEKELTTGNKVLILAPNCTLVDNLHNYMKDYSTIVYSGSNYPDLTKPVMISTFYSARKYQEFFKPSLVIVDECHHVPATTIKTTLSYYKEISIYGMTATVTRPDGLGLDSIFDRLVESKPIKWFIDNGWLASYKVFIPEGDAEKYNQMLSNGEDLVSQLKVVPKILDTYKLWEKHNGSGEKTIIFNFDIAHSKMVNKYFNDKGIVASHIDSTQTSAMRRQLINDFNLGKIQVINNVNCLTEGVDISDIGIVILNSFTKSSIRFLQMIGRGLRPDGKSNKELVIIDSGKNFLFHGDIKGQLHSLETKLKKKNIRENGHFYCSFCQNDIGTIGQIWPSNLINSIDFNQYITKQVCCISPNCESYQDELVVNQVSYPIKKLGSDVSKKINPKSIEYSQLNTDYSALNSLLRKKMKKELKCECIVGLNLPKKVKEKALKEVLGDSMKAKTQIKFYLLGVE